MESLAPVFRTVGLIFLVTGPLQFVTSFLLARNPKFPPSLVAMFQYAGVSFTLAGVAAYFQPFGVEMAQHAIGLIFMTTLVLIALRFRRARDAVKGSPQQ